MLFTYMHARKDGWSCGWMHAQGEGTNEGTNWKSEQDDGGTKQTQILCLCPVLLTSEPTSVVSGSKVRHPERKQKERNILVILRSSRRVISSSGGNELLIIDIDPE